MNKTKPAVEEEPQFKEYSFKHFFNLPEPEWLVADFLPESSYAMAYGAPAAGKTFVTLDMAMSIATGTPFHGRKTKQGKVVYFFGEGKAGLAKRIRAWIAAHPDVDPEMLDEYFKLVPQVPVWNQPDHWRKAAGNAQDAKLVVFDTFARVMRGGDENSSKEVGLANQMLQNLRDLTGVTVMVIHHTAKDGQVERGSTAMRGDMDAMLLVSKTPQGHVNLQISKMKDATDAPSLAFELVENADVKSASLRKYKGQVDSASRMSHNARSGIRQMMDAAPAGYGGGGAF